MKAQFCETCPIPQMLGLEKDTDFTVKHHYLNEFKNWTEIYCRQFGSPVIKTSVFVSKEAAQKALAECEGAKGEESMMENCPALQSIDLIYKAVTMDTGY